MLKIIKGNSAGVTQSVADIKMGVVFYGNINNEGGELRLKLSFGYVVLTGPQAFSHLHAFENDNKGPAKRVTNYREADATLTVTE